MSLASKEKTKKLEQKLAKADGSLYEDTGTYNEQNEAEIRAELVLWGNYAESGPSFDPEGKYLCATCSMRKGENDCTHVVSPISLDTGSCRLYMIGNESGEDSLPEKIGQIESAYTERPNVKGFGCSRCDFGSVAKKADTLGRAGWCGFFGFHVDPLACCFKNTGDDDVYAPGEATKTLRTEKPMEPVKQTEVAKSIFCPLVKVDAAKREVWGVVTAEVPDKENEICDYDTTIPYYKAVVDEMSKATDGANIFPLRAMHGLVAAGKGISIEFRKEAKEVYMGFKVVDDAEWKKVEENVYTGFSQGGRYIKRWKDGDYTRYTAEPGEVSLVDMPCLTRAHFDYVKADGTLEVRKFSKASASDCACKCANCEKGAHGECTAETKCSGSSKKTVVRRLPLISAEKAQKIEAAITEVLEDVINSHAYGQLGKGMYTVGRFAEVVEELKYLWLSLEYERHQEGDESPVTDELKELFSNLLSALLSYTEEQVEELAAHAAAFDLEGDMYMAEQSTDLQKAAKMFAQHHKKAAAHEEAVAAQHEKIMKAHQARASENEAAEAEEDDAKTKKARKASTSFHKSKAAAHEKLHKCHKAFAEHHTKYAAAYGEKDTEKALKLLEIEEPKEEIVVPPVVEKTTPIETKEEPPKMEKTEQPVATPKTEPKTEAAVVAAPSQGQLDINKVLDENLNQKLTKAIEDGLTRVLNSPDFTKQIEDRLAGKMLERLGAAPVPTEVKTFAVARPSDSIIKSTDGGRRTDTSSVDPEFAHLVSVDDLP